MSPYAVNMLIAQVTDARATLAALERHAERPDLDVGERGLYARLLDRQRRDEAAARQMLEEHSGIRLTGCGRWLEPTRPGDLPARRAYLATRLPAGALIDARRLTGGLVGLLYEAVAPVPLVTPADRERGRAAAEVRGC